MADNFEQLHGLMLELGADLTVHIMGIYERVFMKKIYHHSDRKGFKSVDLTMITLTRSFVTYLCYMSLRKSETAFYEYLFRVPFIEIAQAKGWEYECEFPLEPISKKKRIDFVVAYNQQIIGIETKFWNYHKNINKQRIRKDVKKLLYDFSNDNRVIKFKRNYAFILLIGIPEINDIDLNNFGVKINKLWDEDKLKSVENKKNIFSTGDSFVTYATVGKRKYCGKLFKLSNGDE